MEKNDCDRTTQQLHTLVRQRFHVPSLYPYQQLVIKHILEAAGLYGSDAARGAPRCQLVVLPTGSGKSLCFMLPAMLISGITIVVYPLLSLMGDQGRRMQQLGIPCEFLRGGQSGTEREAIWRRLQDGSSRFVITNPETLVQESVLDTLARLPVSLFVIDEVHTVTQWGESFRPSYLELPSVMKRLAPTQVVAFTATASGRITGRIISILFSGEVPHIVRADPDRPNIRYRSVCTLHPLHDIQMLLTYTVNRPALLFCATRKRCEDMAWELYKRTGDPDIRYYHAGLERNERRRTEQWFHGHERAILFSTSAYGMGVDKGDIRTVIHLDIPSDIESYLQETGRAGRDGMSADAVALVTHSDRTRAMLLRNDHPLRLLTGALVQQTRCRRAALLELLGYPKESCNGCDVCEGTASDTADGEDQIIAMITRYPLRFTARQAAAVLCGTKEGRIETERCNPWSAVLGTWDAEDLQRAIGTLVETGSLRRCNLPLVRGKLWGKRRKALP